MGIGAKDYLVIGYCLPTMESATAFIEADSWIEAGQKAINEWGPDHQMVGVMDGRDATGRQIEILGRWETLPPEPPPRPPLKELLGAMETYTVVWVDIFDYSGDALTFRSCRTDGWIRAAYEFLAYKAPEIPQSSHLICVLRGVHPFGSRGDQTWSTYERQIEVLRNQRKKARGGSCS